MAAGSWVCVFLRRGVCVCAHGDHAGPERPPVTSGDGSREPLVCFRPLRSARPALSCGRGAASAAQPGPGLREATDHRLPRGPSRLGGGVQANERLGAGLDPGQRWGAG